jgi:hypothetical protein
MRPRANFLSLLPLSLRMRDLFMTVSSGEPLVAVSIAS